MVTKIINIDNAIIDTKQFREQYKRALGILGEIEGLEEDFKNEVEKTSDTTKLPKPTLSSFFKSRFAAKTKDVVEKGELFETLNRALDE